MRISALLISIFGATTAASGLAADDAAVRKCREIRDSTARLACYDALPLGIPAIPAAPPATAPRAASGAESVRSPAPPAAAGAPAPSAGRATQESGFGLESRATADQLELIRSHIPGAFEGWGPSSRIRLANGQVWQVAADESARRMRLQDPQVSVRRGALGAFYLEFEAHNHSPRVRRVD
jgi:hypothetical protein